LLRPALGNYTVLRGFTWNSGRVVDWGLASAVPGAGQYVDNPLEDHIYTFQPYFGYPGAVLWEACTPSQEQNQQNSVFQRLNSWGDMFQSIQIILGIGAGAGGSSIQASRFLKTFIRSTATVTATAENAEIEDTEAIAETIEAV
jgi:hypothetical protein